MTDDERNELYIAMLRGVARDCQNKLCAEDRQHSWGEAVATDHWPDLPLIPNGRPVGEFKIRRSFHQKCTNCGKVRRW